MKEAIAAEVVKASPSVTVSGLVLFGVPLSEWVIIGSAVLVVLQVFFLLRDKWWRDRNAKPKD